MAFITFLTWPVRAIIIFFKRRNTKRNSKVKRAVVIGLDGLDPELTQQLMNEGKLPNFKALSDQGSFRPLKTTCPSISPVAWSTFSTGTNPAKHRIFDFFTRDPNTYSPVLSSADISSTNKYFRLGPIKIPYRSTKALFLRKSTSFWKILGDAGIFSTVLRVPITFPPEKFYGAELSAMCAPDLLGTQGTFTQFTTESINDSGKATGGIKIPIEINNGNFKSCIQGPTVRKKNIDQPLTIPFEGCVNYDDNTANIKLNGQTIFLKKGEYTPWVSLEFKTGLLKKIRGISRLMLTEINPNLKIYMTPINIDPEKPSLPVSHPVYYSMILSKLYGPFNTMGLSEDTWALNERVIDEGAFLKQTYDIYEDRKKHLFDALNKNRDGLVTCVFDTTDRIQHMFFRYLDADHPANTGKDTEIYKNAIEDTYRRMDSLIAEVIEKLNENDLLIVMSDHGFKPFMYGINLNTWLWKQGYLVPKNGSAPGSEWFADVDWAKTQAYAYGLSGIYLNVQGREKRGIVSPGKEREELEHKLKQELESIRDEQRNTKPIRRVILSRTELSGPYLDDAPELIIGYETGYRASWNSAVGKITDKVIEENTRSWSGDHCIDPDLVPGVFFANWKLEDESPAMEDIAPTMLNLFGIEPKSFHDGKVLMFNKV